MVTSSAATRVFTAADQDAFADLSGDRNPLHLDPVLARRFLFGEVAVHGLHTLLWSLDCICAAEPRFGALRSLRASFDAPVTQDAPLSLTYQKVGSGVVRARVTLGDVTVLRLTAEPGDMPVTLWGGDTLAPRGPCHDVPLDDLGALTGTEPLTLPGTWANLFPALASRFSPAQVAVLLATTRLVGMTCPGLHSVFLGLKLSFGPENLPAEALSYAVRRFDPRVSMLDIAVCGGGVQGELQAFRRPPPLHQPEVAQLRTRVSPGEFAGQRALVIGGSRGLGEITAKLLASGGAEVVVTYARGAEDAARVAADGVANGLDMTARSFDVLSSNQAPLDRPPTHLYYFATPRIPAGRSGVFRAAQFASLLDHYVSGLAYTSQWLDRQVGGQPCTVWVPSTVFLDDPEAEFPEYVAAKACAEALCLRLGAALPHLRFVITRLPRLPSDQTQSLAPLVLQDPCEVMLGVLRAL